MKLSQVITEYITLRQAMGNQFQTPAYYLRVFCQRVGEPINMEEVTPAQVNSFLGSSAPITRSWYEKYNTLGGLYKFAVSRGYVRSVPLPTHRPQLPPSLVPYIYTPEELRRLLEATTGNVNLKWPLSRG